MQPAEGEFQNPAALLSSKSQVIAPPELKNVKNLVELSNKYPETKTKQLSQRNPESKSMAQVVYSLPTAEQQAVQTEVKTEPSPSNDAAKTLV